MMASWMSGVPPAHDDYPRLDFRNAADMRLLSQFVRELSYDKAVSFAATASAFGLADHGCRGWRRAYAALINGMMRLPGRRGASDPKTPAVQFWCFFYSRSPDEAVRFVRTFAKAVTDRGPRHSADAAGSLDGDAVNMTLIVLEMVRRHPGLAEQVADEMSAYHSSRPSR